ncbi:MAG: alpha-L-fucosidase [Bacteroidales bacterium]|nr:alpha-L-fucosidase [Bacteroidales bacterium]
MKTLFFEQSRRDNMREAQVTPHKAKPQCGGLPHKRCAVWGVTIIVLLLAGYTMRAPAQVLPTWEFLNQRGYPQWFQDAKLGIFIHWGLYSVPAYASKEGYGEWFYRGLMQKDVERMRIMSYYADTTKPVFDQYKELTKYWYAELWNPDEWAALFQYAGAKYVVLVTKHHDGYCLWDSQYQPEWNSVVSGPRRNIVEELTTAVRDEGLRMGFYYSLPEWTNPRHIWMVDSDNEISDYVDNYMVPQFKELVTRYKPDLIFSDGDWNNTAEQLRSQELISWYYNTVGKNAIVNNRWGNGTKHGFLTPEYSAGIANTEVPWAECRGLGRSFGLNRNEDLDNYLTDQELIQHFVELVAHGGGLTLNVGPYADGTIPLIQQERLRSLGKWLKINGEAIYGTRPYEIPCQREQISAHLPPSKTINFDWVRNAPMREVSTDNFEIMWTGSFRVEADGNYTFFASADDSMTIYMSINNVPSFQLLNIDKNPSINTNFAQGELDKGDSVFMVIFYREKDMEASASLLCRKDDGKFTPVEADWDGTVFWEKTSRCFTTKGNNLYIIEFERPDRNKPLVIKNMPKINPKAIFHLKDDWGYWSKLKWKQDKDGTLTIDFSSITQELLNHLEHAWVIEVTEYK